MDKLPEIGAVSKAGEFRQQPFQLQRLDVDVGNLQIHFQTFYLEVCKSCEGFQSCDAQSISRKAKKFKLERSFL